MNMEKETTVVTRRDVKEDLIECLLCKALKIKVGYAKYDCSKNGLRERGRQYIFLEKGNTTILMNDRDFKTGQHVLEMDLYGDPALQHSQCA